MARETGEVTVLNTLAAVGVTELSSLPAAEIGGLLSGEQGLQNAEHRVDHDKELINDKYHEEGLTGHADTDPSGQVDQLIDHDTEALGTGDTGGGTAHEAVAAAHQHVMQAHVLVGTARHGGIFTSHDLSVANHHLDVAQGKLELASGHDNAPANLDQTQQHLDEAQAKLEEAQHLKEQYEQDESVAKELKAEVATRNIGAKPADQGLELILNQVLDKLVDVGEERWNKKKEQRTEKAEQVEKMKQKQEAH